jgi:Cu/Ag efflux pump CusA
MDPTLFSTISYSLTSDTRPLSELRDLTQYQIRPILSTVPGVASVAVMGGAIEEYHDATAGDGWPHDVRHRPRV